MKLVRVELLKFILVQSPKQFKKQYQINTNSSQIANFSCELQLMQSNLNAWTELNRSIFCHATKDQPNNVRSKST